MTSEIKIKSQEGLSDKECAEEIGQFLAAVSNEYEPMNLEKLPSYLPSLPSPQVEQHQVYNKLLGLNNTKSTLPIDIPAKLRKEVAVELAAPLTHIINSCLWEGVYPALWKREWVSPIPKVKEPEVLKDVRKVASTSDYNKVLEAFTKEFITEDIGSKLDPKQFGGKKGHGTEHMVVSLMNRVLYLLDNNNTRAAVIKAGVDWSSAFERGDPTETATKFINLGLRPSIVKLLTSYMTSRKMSVKFNGQESSLINLCGGFPAGSVIGQDCFLVASDSAAQDVNEEDRFKYIDDLEILELVLLSGILEDYNEIAHVPSDIPLGHKFLPGSSTNTQSNLDNIARWTTDNQMLLNPSKSSYMLFTRSKEQFVTKLTINNNKIDQKHVSKILGCWIDEDAGKWETNTKELCKSAYGRISMLTKLRYVGASIEDLLDIYKLFIRSRAEYLSVVWHSSLTAHQTNKIENIQKTSLKIILGDNYVNYPAALEMSGLEELFLRRQKRCLAFAKSSLKYPVGQTLFPLNDDHGQNIRTREKFAVNFEHTESYKRSAVPYCQNLLNIDHMKKEEDARRRQEARGRRREG